MFLMQGCQVLFCSYKHWSCGFWIYWLGSIILWYFALKFIDFGSIDWEIIYVGKFSNFLINLFEIFSKCKKHYQIYKNFSFFGWKKEKHCPNKSLIIWWYLALKLWILDPFINKYSIMAFGIEILGVGCIDWKVLTYHSKW
jgi:hypothetical protein